MTGFFMMGFFRMGFFMICFFIFTIAFFFAFAIHSSMGSDLTGSSLCLN